MCFSATASFVASGAIGTVSVVTLKKKKLKSEIPFASIPLLFAIQQFVEGVLWLTFGIPLWQTVLTYIYAFFAYMLWPVFTPLAVYYIEPVLQRKKILLPFIAIGSLVGLYFLALIVLYPVNAQILEHSIFYDINHAYYEVIAVLYLIATAICCLFSSERMIKVFGVALLLSFLAAMLIYQQTVASVWCFFSAILSVIICLHFHYKYKKNKDV